MIPAPAPGSLPSLKGALPKQREEFSFPDPKEERLFFQAEWESRVLHGLSLEWEKGLWVLRSPDRKRMRPPLFSLRDMEDRWGSWSGKKREIALSRNLVWNHSWDAVLEVLRHEMAHQYAEEVLAAHHEPPHGPSFQKACFLLRANPQASGTYPPLDVRVSRESSRAEDKILQRVKKLLALAESQNQHEANAAMAKAHDLIAKYNVDLLAGGADRNFVSFFVGQPALRHRPEDYSFAHLLQDFYFVRGIWVPAFIPQRRRMGRVLEISGTIPNVQIASYVHDFVRRFIQAQWVKYTNPQKMNRYRQTDFALGILEGFRSQLQAQKESKGLQHPALMKIEDPNLKKYIAYKYPRTTKIYSGISSQDLGVRRDGRQIGERMVIAKGISEHQGNRGLRIGS